MNSCQGWWKFRNARTPLVYSCQEVDLQWVVVAADPWDVRQWGCPSQSRSPDLPRRWVHRSHRQARCCKLQLFPLYWCSGRWIPQRTHHLPWSTTGVWSSRKAARSRNSRWKGPPSGTSRSSRWRCCLPMCRRWTYWHTLRPDPHQMSPSLGSPHRGRECLYSCEPKPGVSEGH